MRLSVVAKSRLAGVLISALAFALIFATLAYFIPLLLRNVGSFDSGWILIAAVLLAVTGAWMQSRRNRRAPDKAHPKKC